MNIVIIDGVGINTSTITHIIPNGNNTRTTIYFSSGSSTTVGGSVEEVVKQLGY